MKMLRQYSLGLRKKKKKDDENDNNILLVLYEEVKRLMLNINGKLHSILFVKENLQPRLRMIKKMNVEIFSRIRVKFSMFGKSYLDRLFFTYTPVNRECWNYTADPFKQKPSEIKVEIAMKKKKKLIKLQITTLIIAAELIKAGETVQELSSPIA